MTSAAPIAGGTAYRRLYLLLLQIWVAALFANIVAAALKISSGVHAAMPPAHTMPVIGGALFVMLIFQAYNRPARPRPGWVLTAKLCLGWAVVRAVADAFDPGLHLLLDVALLPAWVLLLVVARREHSRGTGDSP